MTSASGVPGRGEDPRRPLPATREPVMILGAGPLQLPLIRRALDAGLHVITVDNVPANVGHRHAHERVGISTTESGPLVREARRRGVKAVLTACSDIAVPSVAAIADSLGLPGVPLRVTSRWFPKDEFREFQRSARLPHPRFVSGADPEELRRRAGELSGPLVVKPVDRSGSRGARRVWGPESAQLELAIRGALDASLQGRACVEECIPGEEFGGDALVQSGKLRQVFVTRKHMRGLAVAGHSFPPGLPARLGTAVREALQAHVTAARYEDGLLNFDVMIGPDGLARVIELSPRLGGNWIPQLVRYSFGVDLFEVALALARGRPLRLEGRPRPRPAGSFVLGAHRAGVLRSLPGARELRAELPHLVEIEFDARAGDALEPLRDSSQQFGRALCDLSRTSHAETAVLLDRALARHIDAGCARGSQ